MHINGLVICETCGKNLTGQGLIAYIEHPCNSNKFEYKGPIPDNDMRIILMEHDAPELLFTTFGYAIPTETERQIYQDAK